MQPGILERIVATKRHEVAALQPGAAELRASAERAPPVRGFAKALRRGAEVALLAEVKRRSPSAGEIRPGADPASVAREYARAGAAATSVLTDREYFGGELEALRQVRAAVALPALRKDFIIDPLQMWEARGAGADAVLLIVRILDDEVLAALHQLATELGMDVVVEVHDQREIERALVAGARIIGVNNRDLDTFTTDLARSVALAPYIPAEVVRVAESGIRNAADVDRLGASGFDAVLVGESLMRQPNLAAAAASLVGRRRTATGVHA